MITFKNGKFIILILEHDKDFSSILEQFQHIGRPGEAILGSLGALGSTWSPKCGFWTICVKTVPPF